MSWDAANLRKVASGASANYEMPITANYGDITILALHTALRG
ncbi:hypothetical protein NTCA1_56090 [Novosphingobium sp. TCA1]|nr:hypothetical protein NTCA1_56090 [Novosphingobium sp. TCA1]